MNKLKLYRVDLELKYLFLTQGEAPTQTSIVEWLHDIHEGELDGDYVLEIKEVTDAVEINDFPLDYIPYGQDFNEEPLKDLIPNLKLDLPEMVKILKKAGYKVTK